MKRSASYAIFSLVLIIIVILIYYINYKLASDTDDPSWLFFEKRKEIKNQQDVILTIDLDKHIVSTNESVKFIATLTNNSNQTYYFYKSWFLPINIVNNIYDINKKKFILDYPTSCFPYDPYHKDPYFEIKPTGKMEFDQNFLIGKGFYKLGYLPYFDLYLYDGDKTYVYLKGQKTVFFRMIYKGNIYKNIVSKRNIYKENILSNEIKLQIK